MSKLKYLIAFLIPVVFILIANHTLDNDSWYVLAEGKEIATNGIYYEDPLSMHDGLEIVVQNYGFAVIFYWIYSVFGAAGIYICMLILNVIVCYLLYKICMLLSNKNVNLSLLIMLITDLVLIPWFIVTRAQVLSYVFFLSLIYILELYIKTKNKKILWWLPLLSLLQVNLHASLWPMLIVVMVVYCIDGIKAPKLHLQGYNIKPLIIMTILMILVGLINPYGVKMLLLMFSSYGNQTFMRLIPELNPFELRHIDGILLFLAIALSIILQIFGDKKRFKIRYLLMFFGFLALGLNSTKGMSQFILIMFLPVASLYPNAKPSSIIKDPIVRTSIMIWFSLVATCAFVILFQTVMYILPNQPQTALVKAVKAINDTVPQNIDKKSLKIYTPQYAEIGGYAEYMGYSCYIDSRAEVFLKANNKKADILDEWVQFYYSEIDTQEFLDKYDFDYLLLYGNTDPLYDTTDRHYKVIFEDSTAQIKVFQKTRPSI